jgi:LacI family transcriptional regulator
VRSCRKVLRLFYRRREHMAPWALKWKRLPHRGHSCETLVLTVLKVFVGRKCSNVMQVLPTLKDVAQRAGTSVATAGRALGRYGKVASATRERVRKAARKLNYRPNALARSMKQRSSLTIGVIVGNVCNPFFSVVLRAIQGTVGGHGYMVILCDTDESIEKELAHARALLEQRVDGIILSPTAGQKGEASLAAREVYASGVPLVFIDRAVPGMKVPTVVSDNASAAEEATTHLIKQGHRRIGVVVGRRTLDTMLARVEGYRRALSKYRIKFDESLVVDAEHVGVEGGYRATKHLLDLTIPPTALLVMNSLLVLGALNAIKEKGLTMPEDIALIGWDDFDAAPHLQTPLTIVDQPAHAMASIAAEQLMRMRSNEPVDPSLHILKSKFIIRESSEKRLLNEERNASLASAKQNLVRTPPCAGRPCRTRATGGQAKRRTARVRRRGADQQVLQLDFPENPGVRLALKS